MFGLWLADNPVCYNNRMMRKIRMENLPSKDLGDSCDVSIVVISYNHAEYIEECLTGVLTQKINSRHEYIICDDHSDDKTWHKTQEIIK
jgi:cellulose synthase/poly-beta-1,6-N-acetylglucosamine synthase-like glycosyltransferase